MALFKDHTEVEGMKLKTGETKSKRSFYVYDDTGLIEITLWGTMAENNNFQKDDIVCFKGMKVQEYM